MQAKSTRKLHYFYKIINKLNGKFYYGIHSTYNLDDGYMGSGSKLKYMYKKYGIENFEKEIIKFFNTRKECADYEAEVVTENLVLDDNCYNVKCGGEQFNTLNSISVVDKDGNRFRCPSNDINWLNKNYSTATTGMVPVIELSTGKHMSISCDIYHNNKDKYKTFEHSIYVKHINNPDGEYFLIPVSEYAKNKEQYINKNAGKILVKDSSNKCYCVYTDDIRYKNGELVNYWQGRKHSDETKRKISEYHKKNNPNRGDKNPMACRCWIYNDELHENRCILKTELSTYINNGWYKGRKNKYLKSKNK